MVQRLVVTQSVDGFKHPEANVTNLFLLPLVDITEVHFQTTELLKHFPANWTGELRIARLSSSIIYNSSIIRPDIVICISWEKYFGPKSIVDNEDNFICFYVSWTGGLTSYCGF